MKAIEIKPGIFWTGAIDWAVRDFHGYVTPDGTTYNCYLVMDDRVTLVDTVREAFADTCLESIRSVVDPSKISQIIVNHIENDHMGALARVMQSCPGATVVAGQRALKGMERFVDVSGWKVRPVKTGDEISTGRFTFSFIETPMLHWPDAMMTYVREAALLFSQDAFGQHLASAERFDDELQACASSARLDDAVTGYYANILMPFGSLIRTTIGALLERKLPIDMIAPDHGIIWRADPGRVIRAYMDMAGGKADERAVVIYDTMWHGTEMMTQPIVQGIRDEGVGCRVVKLRATPMSDAVTELWKARGCLVGSPTLNNEMFPSVAAFVTYLRGLRPRNRIVGAYGTYGWGGGAVKKLISELQAMKLEVVEPGLEVMFRPAAQDREACRAFGRQFAQKLKAYHRSLESS